jgi:hypothetical protein
MLTYYAGQLGIALSAAASNRSATSSVNKTSAAAEKVEKKK